MIQLIADENIIQNKIYTIRGMQVMLDRDLAEIYGVETKVFNQAVNRNISRFPSNFRFQLTKKEYDVLRSQTVTSSSSRGGRRYLPYVFTEQGISMLSAILKSKIAIKISIMIINTFVNMRKFILSNASVFQRLDNVEHKLLTYDKNFDKLFTALENKNTTPTQGIFFDGQIYDAYIFVNDLLQKAQKEVVLIDNYINDTVLTIFSKYPDLKFTIITKNISKQCTLDIIQGLKGLKEV